MLVNVNHPVVTSIEVKDVKELKEVLDFLEKDINDNKTIQDQLKDLFKD
ncbi:MAG: hypothetical protein J6V44_11845 [Methanobrevibacter sp.]|nr:hypothetical protein [Methanobrevibacter sp.]